MLVSSTSTPPAARAPGTSSCMRLRQRTKVDLPQPDGPIKAVTLFDATVKLILKRACNLPYQALRSRTLICTGETLSILYPSARISAAFRLTDRETLIH